MIEGSNDQARARATDRYGAAVDNTLIFMPMSFIFLTLHLLSDGLFFFV